MIVEGAIAVKAVIMNHKRTVKEVYIDRNKKTKDFNFIRRITRQEGIILHEADGSELSQLLTGNSHGGVGAEVMERNSDALGEGDIFLLDGIEDPFNLAYAMRTLCAFGVKNVLMGKRDISQMEGRLLKSSAGAYEMINVVIEEDLYTAIKDLKQHGYRVYALYRSDGSKDVFDTVFADKALFMLGGEKRGISAQLMELCDEKLFISYGSAFRNALNASAALDVVATLLYRQRRMK